MSLGAAHIRIFISSTIDDLREFREAAVEAVRQLGHESAVIEFAEGASDLSPLQHSREAIASCDALISLIGNRYGFVPAADNPNQYSFVELELRYAWELGKPAFVFMVDERTPWPPQFIDLDSKAELLRRFRKEVLNRVVVAYFHSTSHLAMLVTKALATFTSERSEGRPSPMEPDIPSTVDRFELAWRLVVDFKAEPALLASMDVSELLRATQQWARETRPDESLEGPRLFEAAQAQLRGKQAALAPSALWLAWKRTTGGGQTASRSNA